MCCPLDQTKGKFIPQAVAFEEVGEEKVVYVRGVIDHTPLTFADRITLFFQRLELMEKIAEIADESFHLLESFLQKYTTVQVYQTLRNLHHGAHDIEHVLHAFCVLGDVHRLITGKFFVYKDEGWTKIDYLLVISARISHFFSHLMATGALLADHKLCRFGRFERFFKYFQTLNALGYALMTICLVWRRYQGRKNEHFYSDFAIHFGGFLFEGLPLTKTVGKLSSYASKINKIVAISGIIHAFFIVWRLMPRDREEVVGNFVMPKAQVPLQNPPHNHRHEHDHEHDLQFYPVLQGHHQH